MHSKVTYNIIENTSDLWTRIYPEIDDFASLSSVTDRAQHAWQSTHDEFHGHRANAAWQSYQAHKAGHETVPELMTWSWVVNTTWYNLSRSQTKRNLIELSSSHSKSRGSSGIDELVMVTDRAQRDRTVKVTEHYHVGRIWSVCPTSIRTLARHPTSMRTRISLKSPNMWLFGARLHHIVVMIVVLLESCSAFL